MAFYGNTWFVLCPNHLTTNLLHCPPPGTSKIQKAVNSNYQKLCTKPVSQQTAKISKDKPLCFKTETFHI